MRIMFTLIKNVRNEYKKQFNINIKNNSCHRSNITPTQHTHVYVAIMQQILYIQCSMYTTGVVVQLSRTSSMICNVLTLEQVVNHWQ